MPGRPASCVVLLLSRLPGCSIVGLHSMTLSRSANVSWCGMRADVCRDVTGPPSMPLPNGPTNGNTLDERSMVASVVCASAVLTSCVHASGSGQAGRTNVVLVGGADACVALADRPVLCSDSEWL